MPLLIDAALFGLGLLVVVVSAERLVESTVGASRRLGVSAFLVGVIAIGFDPENLAVGVAASYEATSGIALGTVVGSAMVALALAFGLTAVLVPLEFGRVPYRILALPIGAIVLLSGLALDGVLSRPDGALLLGGYAVAIWLLTRWERQGIQVAPAEAVEKAREAEASSLGASVAWIAVALAGVVLGSELLLRGARPIIDALGWTDTLFGMTLLALLVSVEEVARELPAALRGRPDVTFANVVGSILAFFGFNAGAIALVRPVPVGPTTRTFYLPVCGVALLVIVGLMALRRVPRWGGAVLVALYVVFVAAPFA